MGRLEPQPQGGALYRPDKGESINPSGKPKGAIHLSTWIQKLLNDEKFFERLLDREPKKRIKHEGVPIKAIIEVAITKALEGDDRAMEWLAKHGYGQKLQLTIDDPRRQILAKYGMGDEDVGETPETPSGPPEISA